eukprot:CAMPEP_0116151648 /NCGR_PEP_ID=MMETSP0329-20121206/20215_1 /TAXON_ID=697910 /ORGANISM="Pseudo-nitzschia arenysensis, Strain B593" /LENGTH=412 /DNA_ID=CAMNT_0003648287 /DNA_START=20 /DNA_END=1258 /DNA_ORIENTATION=-
MPKKKKSKEKRGKSKRAEEKKVEEAESDEEENIEPTADVITSMPKKKIKKKKKKSKEKSGKRQRAEQEKFEDAESDKEEHKKKKSKTKRGKSKRVEEEKVEEAESDEEENEEPTDDDLRSHIRRLIPLVNLENTGVKAFTQLLSKECGDTNLKPRMKFIKVALSEAINALDDDGDDDESEKEEEPKKPRKTGLSVKKEISTELAGFLGRDPAELIARTDVVKAMWDYIKAKDLQNPENKREIILDDKMKELFGCDTFTMFTLNKYISAHVHPFKPVDLTTNTKKTAGTPGRKRKRDSDNGDEKVKRKRKPKKPGLQPPYKLSDELAELVGTNILPRPQVVKAIWAHIKKHELQNPEDKREILCDDKLKKVMGGESKVTMFNMNRYVTDHLLEKLDRSEYNHEETEAELQARD